MKSMFESFLDQQENNKKEQIRSKFFPFSGNEDKYDVYLILRRNNDRGEPDKSEMLCWCNVLKFGDPFWETLETKKP